MSDSSTEEDEGPRTEPDDAPPVAMETQVRIGDCQILKVPIIPDEKEKEIEKEKEKEKEPPNETVSSSTPNSVTITPIATLGDCTIRVVNNTTENNT